MNILHLFSDWKWTGPAEPVLMLCQELSRRGHNVVFAYRRPPKPRRSIATFVPNYQVTATDSFRLNRYFSWTDNPRDVRDLRRFLVENRIDVLNTHLAHDHLLGMLAVGWRGPKSVLVRTDHKRDSLSASIGNRLLLSRTHGLITFSDRSRQHLIRSFKLAPEKVCKVNPAVDVERFNPSLAKRTLRTKWNLDADDIAFGIVARFQPYRKTDLFLEALALAVKKAPNIKAVLIGHGSLMPQTVHKPIERLKLQKHAVLAGYLVDRHYVNGLASLDAFVFLMAGSDGTGRALREAMAMGKPALVNNVGMLPEMIDDGKSGFVFNGTVHDLAEKLVRLARDPHLRKSMSEAALQKARLEFSIPKQAQAVESFYKNLLLARNAKKN